ncbi:MAG: energy-coupling factor transporter transmembrane component T [Cetobacterium sp.]
MENKFDPRTVFYTTIIYVIALSFIRRYYQILIILPFIGYQMKLFSVHFNKLKKVLKYSLGLLFSMVFVNILLMGKSPNTIFVSIFRMLIIVFLGTSMISKMEIREIGFVIEKLLNPLKVFKVPVESISVITALGFKFIPMLEAEGKRILLAQKARGIDYKLMTVKERIKNIPTLFFPVILSGIQNAINLAISMEVRGYGNGIERTRLKDYKMLKKDYIYIFLTLILCFFFSMFCITISK